MDSLTYVLDQEEDGLMQDIRAEVRHLWMSGGIDREDFDLSFNACLYVALCNVAERRKSRGAAFDRVVANLESF